MTEPKYNLKPGDEAWWIESTWPIVVKKGTIEAIRRFSGHYRFWIVERPEHNWQHEDLFFPTAAALLADIERQIKALESAKEIEK